MDVGQITYILQLWVLALIFTLTRIRLEIAAGHLVLKTGCAPRRMWISRRAAHRELCLGKMRTIMGKKKRARLVLKEIVNKYIELLVVRLSSLNVALIGITLNKRRHT